MTEPTGNRDADPLPLALPTHTATRIVLVMIRRMAAHGLRDARAAMLALDVFGPQFQRPLLLTRSLVVELARTSGRRIELAPCCALGMTRDEGLIVDLIGGGGLATLAALTDDSECRSAYATAEALGAAITDCCPV
ncbi:hypothetical protein E3U23_04725 [Erythrobacter litoralis]|uniref:DUF6628 family protein n=1 Tax=Erythrobacter litoralis TaxID=39960 RepID=UPI002435A773|nr:DUF6628 family protein [Erythrobacter litoralis]MDG6078495.1 hypothetical protein [Erythrobacter litoralis]